MVLKVIPHFGVVGFPLEAQSARRMTFSTLIEPRLTACMIFVIREKERGMFRAICGALSCQVHELPAGAHNVKVPRPPLWRLMKQPQDHPRWSTRQPRWRLMRRGCAGGLTTCCLCAPRNAKEIGRTVRDSSGAATVRGPPLRVGRLLTFRV